MTYAVKIIKDGLTIGTYECADEAQTVRQMTIQFHIIRKLSGLPFEGVGRPACEAAAIDLAAGEEVEWTPPGAIIRARHIAVAETVDKSAHILNPNDRRPKVRIG